MVKKKGPKPKEIEHVHVLQLLSLSDCGIISFSSLSCPFLCPSLSQISSCSFLCSVFRVTSFLCTFLLSIQLGELFHRFFSDFLASHFFSQICKRTAYHFIIELYNIRRKKVRKEKYPVKNTRCTHLTFASQMLQVDVNYTFVLLPHL